MSAQDELPHAGLDALRALVDRLGRTGDAPGAPAPHGVALPLPLKAVSAFGPTWTRLRAERRLREALEQVPAQAGPLNSSQVVHRALRELHALSPAYLDAFVRHVDTLLWLEQSAGLGEARPGTAARGRPGSRRTPVARAQPGGDATRGDSSA